MVKLQNYSWDQLGEAKAGSADTGYPCWKGQDGQGHIYIAFSIHDSVTELLSLAGDHNDGHDGSKKATGSHGQELQHPENKWQGTENKPISTLGETMDGTFLSIYLFAIALTMPRPHRFATPSFRGQEHPAKRQ